MKKYITPEIEVIKFAVEDIVTTSVITHDEDELGVIGIKPIQ